ncbi:PREDICTED: beta-1-syntrophin [Aptenodytes forsteri]|nr:PREDICTED: beta-1-syntrophin [Aptenodytes forsteri]
MVSISPALEARSYRVGITWRQADCTALTLEEKQGLRSTFGGSAMFAVQCIAVKSGLLMAVSKELPVHDRGVVVGHGHGHLVAVLSEASPCMEGLWSSADLLPQLDLTVRYVDNMPMAFDVEGERRVTLMVGTRTASEAVLHQFFANPVKYMREATPYVKKGSPVSEIGWETPPPESPRLGCASADPLSQLSLSIHRDKKTIPLKMCYVTRNMTVSDPENRLIEVHSPDAKHTVVLRSKDSATAQAWFNAIHSSVNELIPRVIAEVRDQLGKTGIAGSREIRHLGWLAEKVPGDNEKHWKPVLVVLTEKDLLIYESMPRMKEAWFSPLHTYPLLATRLVHSGPGKGSPQSGMDLSFATRTGTRQGIETHVFRTETSRDLSLWTRSVVQGCHNSAELITEITTSCTYKSQECRLTIHYEHGFSLTTEPQDGAFSKTIAQYPYEKLKMSSDDGIRMLYLDFGGKDGEIQLDLHSCPKPIVFIIHSFLSAKITRLGLVA